MELVRAACHCTSIKLQVRRPKWVLDCNCTICRRYGALWTYPRVGEVELIAGEHQLEAYCWGDRDLAFQRCTECGCVTHFSSVAEQRIYAVNARMIPTLDPSNVEVHQRNNSHTGFFWTRSNKPPSESHHPVMPMPTPEDWR